MLNIYLKYCLLIYHSLGNCANLASVCNLVKFLVFYLSWTNNLLISNLLYFLFLGNTNVKLKEY